MFRDRNLYQDMTEAERRIANVAILARVVKIDPQRARVKVKGVLAESELNGQTLSEAALVDSAGQLIAMKTFAPKVKEADERIEITLTIRF